MTMAASRPTSFTFFVLLGIRLVASTPPAAPVSMYQAAGRLSERQLETRGLSMFESDGKDAKRIEHLKEALQPMVMAAPRESDDSINPMVVRYILHRFFMQSHGWFIKGLEPQRLVSGSSASDGAAKDRVPSYLENVMEQMVAMEGRTLALNDVAILAATLEDIIKNEADDRMTATFATMDLDKEESLDRAAAQELMDIYTMFYLTGGNISVNTPEVARTAMLRFTMKYPEWVPTEKWIREIEDNVSEVDSDRQDSDPVSYSFLTKVAEQIGEKMGAYNDGSCRGLKQTLMEIEDEQQPGRVRLSAFYKKALHSFWKFIERPDYLRDLGALDETDPQNPRVIIPNYVGSRPQCLESSGFYAVCCRNECEDLMSGLEKHIGGPMAEPSEIGQWAAAAPSDTVSAPRELSQSLLRRLDEVATHHGGKVPLEGRLFAQWMHHAFPRECPYPHASGTISPLTPDEWMVKSGVEDSSVTEQDLQCASDKEDNFEIVAGKEMELPWSEDEELFTVSQAAGSLSAVSRVLRIAVLAVVAVALALASKIATPQDGMNKAAAGRGPVWWGVTLAMLVLPLLIIMRDFLVDAVQGNHLLVCILCCALAAWTAFGLRQSMSFRGILRADDSLESKCNV